MRKVTLLPILIFQALLALPLALAVLAAFALDALVTGVPLGGVIQALLVMCVFLAATVLVYRLYLRIWPLPEGDLPVGSTGEFRYLTSCSG